MFGFLGASAQNAAYLVRDLKAGGVIYFARNVGSVAETSALSAALQEMAMESGGLPLFISADQEGGLVSRLTLGLPAMPGPMAVGATCDVSLAEKVSRAIGTQLRAAGVNVNLAPVLDVNDNPRNPVIGVRSFGEDPSAVSAFGRAAVKGYLSSGIFPVGKHFPGHGNTSVDSHLDLPALSQSMDRLEQVELAPFKAAIAEGLPAIMTAHIIFKALDPTNPATMSRSVLHGLLREKMGFRGLIMTDCMEMQAVARNPGVVRASIEAFRAGADLLLVSHTRSLQEEACRALLESVKSGDIPMERLDESVERILASKEAMGLPNPLDPASACTEELERLSEEAHARSVTIVRSRQECFPIDRTASVEVNVVAAVVEPKAPAGVVSSGAGSSAAAALSKALRKRGIPVRDAPAAEFLSGVHTGPTVIVTQNAWKDASQASLAAKLLEVAPHAAVVAVRDPYDASALPSAQTVICSYSPRPEAMKAAAAVLSGDHKATGRLPVRVD